VQRAALLEISRIWQGVDAWNPEAEWQEWMPETNMSNKSFFGSALHFCEHEQLKGWPPQKPSRNFTVTGTSCKNKKDCKSWEQTIYGERSFESITDAQLLLQI